MRHVPVILIAGLLVGCASGASPRAAVPTPGKPPLVATRAASKGEILVRGDSSPASLGPYAFAGRYLVRFAQYAPENPKIDFTGETPFTAALTLRDGDPRGAIKLFQQARAGAERSMALRGRYFVEVSFGDYPFVIRFTPQS
jgi:hypothetical protein